MPTVDPSVGFPEAATLSVVRTTMHQKHAGWPRCACTAGLRHACRLWRCALVGLVLPLVVVVPPLVVVVPPLVVVAPPLVVVVPPLVVVVPPLVVVVLPLVVVVLPLVVVEAARSPIAAAAVSRAVSHSDA